MNWMTRRPFPAWNTCDSVMWEDPPRSTAVTTVTNGFGPVIGSFQGIIFLELCNKDPEGRGPKAKWTKN